MILKLKPHQEQHILNEVELLFEDKIKAYAEHLKYKKPHMSTEECERFARMHVSTSNPHTIALINLLKHRADAR